MEIYSLKEDRAIPRSNSPVSICETPPKKYILIDPPVDVSVDPSEEPTEIEQSPSTVSTKLGHESESHVDRVCTRVAANGLYIETALAVVAIAFGILAIPFVTFGLFTALEGETSILTGGLIIAAGGIASLVTLAVTLLVHAYTEIRRYGLSFVDGHSAVSTAYTVIRGIENVTAGIFLLSLFAVIFLGIAMGSVPELLPVVVGISAILLLVVVTSHACGATLRYALDL